VGGPTDRLWRRLFFDTRKGRRRARWRTPVTSAFQTSATIFLILRRMRVPLITLIAIFAVSVLGLTLIPGRDATGAPARMSFFDAFYFMSFTATTIGLGELPHAFTNAQRLWVIVAIYLTVIGWAYALGSLLTLLQDRKFRQALAVQHFTRKVARLREPFLLFAGYGRTGRLLGRSFDSLGRRIVVIDLAEDRINALDVDPYNADVPGLVGDARNPHVLEVAGLGHPDCEAVLAMTDSDEVNLAVTMAAALLRPELQVVARTVSPLIAHRMRAFGTPAVINPFDRFGDHLRLALRAPASYQLLTWLANGPGTPLPSRGEPPGAGRWVVCGYGRFGRELTADLRANGSEVTVIDGTATDLDRPAADEAVRAADEAGTAADEAGTDPADVRAGLTFVTGDASDPRVIADARLDDAVGFVAGTNNDTTNLSLVAVARKVNPDLFVVARQNDPDTSPLFGAMRIDSLLVATEVVAHEAYARLSTPLLWRFLQELPGQGEEWADALIGRLATHCGFQLQALWKVRLTPKEAPALNGWLGGEADGGARLGDLLRDPADRARPLPAVVLLALRVDGQCVVTPADDFALAVDDELLLAGPNTSRTALRGILTVDATFEQVVRGRHVPASTVWRWLTRSRDAGAASGGMGPGPHRRA
jgi:Trk K+ transport system NAD-binding subunit